MTSGQKIAFSLLTTICLFVGSVVALNSVLLDKAEIKFYTQAKIKETTDEVNKLSESCDSYIQEILSKIEKSDDAWVKNASVHSYYVQNPSEKDVNERRKLTEQLFNEISALKGIRIIDINGRNVHYSSFDDTDILKINGITKVYKNYPNIETDANELSFETIKKQCNGEKSSFIFDESKDRLIIYVPFTPIEGITSGLCLFYFNIFDIQNELVNQKKLEIGQNITSYSLQNGEGAFVFGIPSSERKIFRESVIKALSKKVDSVSSLQKQNNTPEKLLQKEDASFYVIISSTRSDSIKVSAIYNSRLFEFSNEFKLLIYICVFITILLLVFIIFSFFRDPVTTLEKRIKKVQIALLEDYLENKEKKEWKQLSSQLRRRKKDFTEEIIKSLHVHSKKRKAELNEYLDKNWEEIFAIFDTKIGDNTTTDNATTVAVSGPAELTGASIEEIRRVIEEVLQSHNFGATKVIRENATSVAQKKGYATSVVQQEMLDDVEELAEEIEDVEEVLEDIDEVEELVDDVEEITDVQEEIEDVEELLEDVDEAEEVEDVLEDVDEVEELLEDVDNAENIEELDKEDELLEEAEDIDELEDLEDEIEDLEEEVEELEQDSSSPEKTDDVFSFPTCLIASANYEYKPSNSTYIEKDDFNFASVENLYAEELCLGSDYKPSTQFNEDYDSFECFPFTTYVVYPQKEPEECAILEDSTLEELSGAYYSMTDFAENIEELSELECDSSDQNSDVIIENNGVFSIKAELNLAQTNQDESFKALVDSVL